MKSVNKKIHHFCTLRAGRFRPFRRLPAVAALVLALTVSAYPFGKNKVNREVFDWDVLRTVHYDVYFPRGMEPLARYTARVAEEGYVHLANYFYHELTHPVPVVVYPSHLDFQANNIIQSVIGEGVGGFTESLKTRVVVPFTGSYDEFRHVLVHELTHAFQFNMLFRDTSGREASRFSTGNVPLWVMEGLAEYFSIGYDETCDMVMRDILYNEHYASLMDLTRHRVKSAYLFYKEGQAFFYFFEQKYGREAIGELFRDARDMNFEEAVRARTGKSLKELNLEWIRFYKKRYYPVVAGRNFDEEEGEQVTFHLNTKSSFNVAPAISPDSRKIAYLTNRDIYTDIALVDVKKELKGKKKAKERRVRSILRGNTSARFEGMHLLSNNLTWSADGGRICFVSQSNGRDVIFEIDPERGNVLRETKLPFRSVRDPYLSKDGKAIAFIGQDNLAADLYLYDTEKNSLRRLTDDRFSERYPSLSPDGSFVVFSSNHNDGGVIDGKGYRIHKIELNTGARTVLVNGEGNNLQSDISPDAKRLVYISNRTGIYNAFTHDIATGRDEMVTNALCGIFYPRWFPDGERIAFAAYQNLGYDLFVKNLSESPGRSDPPRATEITGVEYAPSYFDMSAAAFDEYAPSISPDYVVFGVAGAWGRGAVFTGFTQVGLSDYLGDHRIVATVNYLRYDGEDNVDYNFAYYYLRHRWDYGLGVFRQRNPIFGIYSLADIFTGINSIIHNVYTDTRSIDRYGGYFIASYPLSTFFRLSFTSMSSRYEWDYKSTSDRLDVFANLNQLSCALNYDNVLWGPMVPLDGVRGKLQFTQSFDLTGQDFVYSSADIDLRRYFLVGRRYVFAFRGSGGKIFGRDDRYFKYYLGGFNTLRGHPFFEYSGTNLFLFNAEFRFTFIEGIKFGFPLFFMVPNIGGVIFADGGSAWDGGYRFRDPETGEFDDFKADLGFGLRFTIYPLIILKLDWAWPYYYNRFGGREILFSLGFEF